jgi:hypothetical protein
MNKMPDETWPEWAARVSSFPIDDKNDYIEETIYAMLNMKDSEKAGKITGMLIEMGIDRLIPLLEDPELFDGKIYELNELLYQEELEYDEDVDDDDDHYHYQDDDDDANDDTNDLYPVKTITVADMIAALSKLPPDGKLVITETGFYSNSEFADVMLPEPYTVGTRNKDSGYVFPTVLSDGTQVYRIGHSHQSY